MREDWIECNTEDIGQVITGGTPSKKKPEFYSQDDYPFYKPTDLNAGINVKKSKDYLSTLGYANSRKADKNSILVTCIGATIGKTGLIKNDGAFNQQINALIPFEGLSSVFLYYQIIGTVFQQQIKRNAHSTTLPILNKSKFLKLKLNIPPQTIQKAIVKKIEALFSSLDSGIADLKKVQDQLVIYRQAVLKKAFEGELTKEWRAKQTNLPSADELLEQIKEERQKHYEEQLANWKVIVKIWEKNGNGKKPKKPKKIIDYPEIEQSSTLPILNLGELVFQISNKMMPNEAPEFPFIGMDCLEKNALKPHFTYKFKEFKSAGNWFNKNHVLYGRLRPYLNKVYQAEYEGVASGEFMILETIKGLNPNYLKLILHQQDFVHWSNNQSAGDKPRVKFDQIALYPIKVPTIKEQHQIVQEIESRLSVCDTVEKDLADSLEKAQALRQSILKKAFEGKLLSEDEIAVCKQHKDYEPASVLLEKIKAEKKKK